MKKNMYVCLVKYVSPPVSHIWLVDSIFHAELVRTYVDIYTIAWRWSVRVNHSPSVCGKVTTHRRFSCLSIEGPHVVSTYNCLY
jgi:hypothetical protein